jgi:hypothetical protein
MGGREWEQEGGVRSGMYESEVVAGWLADKLGLSLG